MIRYVNSAESITPNQLGDGFFDGWPNLPSRDIHIRILRGSDYLVVALDEDAHEMAGVGANDARRLDGNERDGLDADDAVALGGDENIDDDGFPDIDLDANANAGLDGGSSPKVIGFITAITDRVLCAYIPLLEVLPEYQHRGIGTELVTRMMAQLDDYYMIDLSCDSGLQPFYEKQNMQPALAMIKRNYRQQSGRGAQDAAMADGSSTG